MSAETVASPIVAQSGGGAVAGGVIGYAVKKAVKILLILIGLQLALLTYLETQGYINGVDWGAINSGLADLFGALNIDQVGQLAANVGLVGGPFAGGFALGFYKG